MKSVMLFMALELSALFVGLPPSVSSPELTQTDCHLNVGPCIKTTDDLTVILDVNPKPLKTMHELIFTAVISNEGGPVADAFVTINLSMPGMFMGKNVIRLEHLHDGTYEGKGVVIRCQSGKKIWQASVAIEQAGKESVVTYIFEVP